ncbi:hypothetical protein J6590_096450 [Homalodisca vitripennis]|nr:hypothetical protein J6590_096450 [Homalodisca vitripennis]
MVGDEGGCDRLGHVRARELRDSPDIYYVVYLQPDLYYLYPVIPDTGGVGLWSMMLESFDPGCRRPTPRSRHFPEQTSIPRMAIPPNNHCPKGNLLTLNS